MAGCITILGHLVHLSFDFWWYSAVRHTALMTSSFSYSSQIALDLLLTFTSTRGIVAQWHGSVRYKWEIAGLIAGQAKMCWDVVLLGKALSLHVHSFDPRVSGYGTWQDSKGNCTCVWPQTPVTVTVVTWPWALLTIIKKRPCVQACRLYAFNGPLGYNGVSLRHLGTSHQIWVLAGLNILP